MSRAAAALKDAVRLRAQRRVMWMEAQWRRERSSPDQGLAISPGQVARILEGSEQRVADEAEFARHPDVAALSARIAVADRALADAAGWCALVRNFALAPAETHLLALVLAEALDPEFGRVVAYLHDDARLNKATPWLAGQLYPEDEIPLQPKALLRWRLATPVEAQGVFPATAFQVDEAVLNYVANGRWRDPLLDGLAALPDPAEVEKFPILYAPALAKLQEAAASGVFNADLLGQEGSGRRVLAQQLAAALNRPLLAVNCAAIKTSPHGGRTLAIAVLRLARITDSIVLWRHGEQYSAEDLTPEMLQGASTLRAIPPDTVTRADSLAVRLEKPTIAARLAVWRALSADPPPPLLVSQRLAPGEIALLAAAAPQGDGAWRFALRRVAPPDGEVLSRLECPYTWDDLVVPPEIAAQLREFVAQIKLRWDVYENWGFRKLVHLGEGIAALFAGPSGTGKTMAAQIMAREIDLDLYRVDLAGVINKYVGETEKRLRDVFAFGERAGALLFFDEADALFGSRMQVKDSHDRFANIEIDYLLQRIERFDGIAILATNRKSDIDIGFLRRLRFIVDFVPPGPAQRLAIWRKALPETTPDGARLLDDIDWSLLAERMSLTGADIKSAALSAAFLARSEGRLIGMGHLLAAVQREMAKRGQVLRMRPVEAAQ